MTVPYIPRRVRELRDVDPATLIGGRVLVVAEDGRIEGQQIEGVEGPEGPEGPQGPEGPAGQDGADGADGSDGADGAPGPSNVLVGHVVPSFDEEPESLVRWTGAAWTPLPLADLASTADLQAEVNARTVAVATRASQAALDAEVAARVAAVQPLALQTALDAEVQARTAAIATRAPQSALDAEVAARVAAVAPLALQTALDAEASARAAADALLAPQSALDAEASARAAGDAAAVKLAPSGAQVILAPNATTTPVNVRGAASQSANLQAWQDSAGAVKAAISAGGALTAAALTVNSSALLVADVATTTPLIVRGAASQSGNLQQWQTSASAVLAAISTGGYFVGAGLRDTASVGPLLDMQSNKVIVTARNVSDAPLVVQGATSQTGDLTQWRDGASTVKSSVNAFGSALFRTVTQFGTAAVSVMTPSATSEGVVVRGITSQSADMQQWQNPAGATVARISSGGAITTASSLSVGTATVGVAQALIVNGTATLPVLVVRAAASQSANAQEWQNSGGTAIAAMDGGGNLFLNGPLRTGLLAANTGGATGNFVGIANVGTAPAGQPSGGGVLYAVAGALFWKGSAGPAQQIATA